MNGAGMTIAPSGQTMGSWPYSAGLVAAIQFSCETCGALIELKLEVWSERGRDPEADHV